MLLKVLQLAGRDLTMAVLVVLGAYDDLDGRGATGVGGGLGEAGHLVA